MDEFYVVLSWLVGWLVGWFWLGFFFFLILCLFVLFCINFNMTLFSIKNFQLKALKNTTTTNSKRQQIRTPS